MALNNILMCYIKSYLCYIRDAKINIFDEKNTLH